MTQQTNNKINGRYASLTTVERSSIDRHYVAKKGLAIVVEKNGGAMVGGLVGHKPCVGLGCFGIDVATVHGDDDGNIILRHPPTNPP